MPGISREICNNADEFITKLKKMAFRGFNGSEKAHCILWNEEGYGYTAIQRKFRMKCQRETPAGSSFKQRYKEYQSRGGHSQRKELVSHKLAVRRTIE